MVQNGSFGSLCTTPQSRSIFHMAACLVMVPSICPPNFARIGQRQNRMFRYPTCFFVFVFFGLGYQLAIMALPWHGCAFCLRAMCHSFGHAGSQVPPTVGCLIPILGIFHKKVSCQVLVVWFHPCLPTPQPHACTMPHVVGQVHAPHKHCMWAGRDAC